MEHTHIRALIFGLVLTLATVNGLPKKKHAAPKQPAEELSSDEVKASLKVQPHRRADIFMCGSDTGIDNGESGIIYSPGYPSFYPNNQDCSVTVDQPSGVVSQTLTVTANAFWTERNFDFLYIYYGDNGEFQRFTGNAASDTDENAMPIGEPLTFSSTTGALRFRFTSDVSVIEPGFNVTYSVTEDSSTPPPATDSPTAGDRCSDVSGEYRSSDGALDMIIEQDKDATDTDYQIFGIYRNNTNPIPIWLQFLGHSGAGASQSYGLTATVYGATNLVTLTGLCEECANGRQLDMYEIIVEEDSPDCVGNPTVTTPVFVRFFQNTGSKVLANIPKREWKKKMLSLTKRH